MDSDPVTIIVKAPNQQFEDQTIQCELSWTIKRLKGLLSEVYPSKPKTDEQKLIYSGQLLSDAIVLKDILRQYEGQDTHTVHLVLQPKNRVFETTKPSKVSQIPTQQTVNTDGLRQRARPSNVTDDGIYRPQASWGNVFPSQNQDQTNAWAAQQMASYNIMMEQIYRQYYTQYMNNVGQSNSTFLSQNPAPNNLPQMPYYPQQNYFTSPFTFNTPLSQQQQQQQQPPQQPQNNPVPAQQPPVAAQPPQVAPPQPQVPQQPLPDQQPNPAQQRFPNIVQEEVENRDWLDMFYAFSRLMVLVTLVYFYSSPLRCLIVIFFTILYYGYHVGYFRQFNREQNNNNAEPNGQLNNNNNENIAQPPAAAEQQQRPVDADDNEENPNANDAADPLVNPVGTTDNDGANNENNRTPVIVLVRTFIMSFFASLIPETPAL